nr:MAG TPA: hypothetical protein [Caudoviricetes sp.]
MDKSMTHLFFLLAQFFFLFVFIYDCYRSFVFTSEKVFVGQHRANPLFSPIR